MLSSIWARPITSGESVLRNGQSDGKTRVGGPDLRSPGARRDLERTRGVLDRISTRAQIDAVIAPPSRERVIGLYEVGKIVNSTRDLSAVLEDIVDLALKRFNAERGMVLLTDHITGKLAIKVARNLKTGREEEAEAISHGVVERVVKEGKSMVSADARIDPRFAGRDSILAHSIVSFICVPLRVKDRPVGAIYVDHRGAPRLFSESDKTFFQAFADLAAVAIENARLVEELLEARQRLSVENESLKANLSRSWNLDALVGHSEAARKIKLALPRAAAGTGTVLIRGESGTGKNLVARILHALGPRSQGPFVQFNCAALPDSLAESELFGHEKGSFTGADRRKPGRFELAQGGSIFLDQIGKATLAIQAKLLRVVEDKEFERVGGTLTLKTDAVDSTATNLDLEQAIQRNEFREDLFYRLNVVPIEICLEKAQGRPSGSSSRTSSTSSAGIWNGSEAAGSECSGTLHSLSVAREHSETRGDAAQGAGPDAWRRPFRARFPVDPGVAPARPGNARARSRWAGRACRDCGE